MMVNPSHHQLLQHNNIKGFKLKIFDNRVFNHKVFHIEFFFITKIFIQKDSKKNHFKNLRVNSKNILAACSKIL